MNKLNLFVGIIILMYKEGIVLLQFFADITLLDCGNFYIYERFKYRKKEKKNTGWNYSEKCKNIKNNFDQKNLHTWWPNK